MRRVWEHRFRRTTLTLLLCLGILGGVGLARAGFSPAVVWSLAVAAFLVLGWRRRNLLTLVAVIAVGLLLGGWRGSVYVHKLADYGAWYHQPVTVTARATEDAVYDDHKQLTFKAGDVTIDGQKLAGQVQLSGFGVNAVFQGDEVTATGKLYPGYGADQASLSFAKLQVTAHHPSLVSDWRRRFASGMQTALPEPLASFAMGLLIGQRATLPNQVKQDLLMVGLTHIIAVSGYNLTIILRAGQRLMAGRSKRLATFSGFGLIAVFLLLAGTSASIVRAAIVSVLSISAGYYGRSFKPLNLLALAAVITVWAKPFYLWGDISWYLSFLAFFGVMVLAPLIQKRWPGRWHQSVIGAVALESVCAEIMSMPFIVYIFGQMSLVGLPANVLVVALIPLAMLLSLIAGLAGMLLPALAGWLAWPAKLLLNYMLDVAHIMAGWPHVFLQNLSLPLATMLGGYGIVISLAVMLRHKTKRRKVGIITGNERTQQMVNYQTAKGR